MRVRERSGVERAAFAKDVLLLGIGHSNDGGGGGVVVWPMDDKVDGGSGADEIQAGAGDDLVYGGEGDDLLKGGQGADQLIGEAGNDTLDGGRGDDYLNGGDDANHYVLSEGTDVIPRFVGGRDSFELPEGAIDPVFKQGGDKPNDLAIENDWNESSLTVSFTLDGKKQRNQRPHLDVDILGSEMDDFEYDDGSSIALGQSTQGGA